MKHFSTSFQSQTEQIEIATFLIKYISYSAVGEKLSSLGIISSWLEMATKLPEDSL